MIFENTFASSFKTVNGLLEKDYLWDFSKGSFDLYDATNQIYGFYIDSGHVIIKEFLNTYDSRRDGSPNQNYWQTLCVINNDPVVNFQAMLYPSPNYDQYTRINDIRWTTFTLWPGRIVLAANENNGDSYPTKTTGPNGIRGPYRIIADTPGEVKIDLYLYFHPGFHTSSDAHIVPSLPLPQHKAIAKATKTFHVYQKAVAITKEGSSQGILYLDGSTINKLTGSSSILDKTNNRGDSITSEWRISKRLILNNVETWPTAVLGVDYDLIGTITSDTITITWLIENQFHVTNFARGESNSSTGANESASILFVNVTADVPNPNIPVDEITWPSLTTLITPQDNERFSSETPITGIAPLKVKAEVSIGMDGLWKVTYPDDPTNPIYLEKTEQDWKDTLMLRADARCIIKSGAKTIRILYGWGPHNIELTQGTYDIQFNAYTKVSQVQTGQQGGMSDPNAPSGSLEI